MKILIAFSGGLDTSYCTKHYAANKENEVHTAIVNTGGFSDDDLFEIEQKAFTLGAKTHKTLDISQEYYQKCIRYLVFGNVLRNNTYPLSVSSERSFQAMALVEYAKEIKADTIVHGSTGAGNDQIRFELIFKVLAPEINIEAPIRDMKLSRKEEVDYLQKQGFDFNSKKAEYSINKGLWGTSIGGKETMTSHKALPEEAFPSKLETEKQGTIVLEFQEGEIHSLNNITYNNKIELINKIEKTASKFAVGRDIHIGDTIIGIKGRVGFEAAAAMLIIKAHHALEKHVLTDKQMLYKDNLANNYGILLHEAQYLEPAMRDIEAFLESYQKRVTGSLYKTSSVQFRNRGY